MKIINNPPPELLTIGNEIRRQRMAHGLTIMAVSKVFGFSHGYLSHIENGKQKARLVVLETLLTYFGVNKAKVNKLMSLAKNYQPKSSGTKMKLIRPPDNNTERKRMFVTNYCKLSNADWVKIRRILLKYNQNRPHAPRVSKQESEKVE